MIVHKSEVIDISGGDHAIAISATGIYCGADGTVVAKLRGDSAARPWVVKAGNYLLGDFDSVEQAGTSAELAAANMLIAVSDRR